MPRAVRINAGVLVAILGALTLILLPAWERDPDLQHGLFVPLLCLILVVESRLEPTPKFFGPGGVGDWAALGLAMLSLATLAVAGVYLAALDWSHALVQFLLVSSVVFLLGAGWLAFADGQLRWISASWSAAVAIILWLLAVPLPPGTYSALTQSLQHGVTFGVVNSLQILGIPAYQAGNVIELAKMDLGVDEACSGVRSLLASLAAGLFVSSVFAPNLRARIIVVLAAPVSALALNFVRSFVLAFVASQGIPIAGKWHDGTGFAIIVLTTALLLLIGWRCGGRPFRYPPANDRANKPLPVTRRQKILSCALICYTALAVTLAGMGALAHRRAPASRPLDLAKIMPSVPAGWKMKSNAESASLESILKTKDLAVRTYWLDGSAHPTEITLYLGFWQPGQAPISLVSAHTPDVCVPGVGWAAQPAPALEASARVGGRSVPKPQSRVFGKDGLLLYVWFWHLVGGRPMEYENPYSVFRLFDLALKYGFQPGREQLFVRISSNRSWGEISSQPVVEKFFENLRPLGL